MNIRMISRLLGVLMLVLCIALSASIPWSMYHGETGTIHAFLYSILITGLVGLALYLFGRTAETKTIHRREALILVSISWVMLGIFGGLPYLFDGAFDNFADAYFETISGFTTTGSTVLTDIESLSYGLHFWRMMTHWLGGMGIIVLFIAIFPQLGVGAKHLFKSEVPGPITEGLKPKIKETSTALWRIYAGLTAFEVILLWGVGGMDLFNAICHSMATMATGGFSTKNASIKGFDTPEYNGLAIDLIIIAFMFFAGINFSLYYALLKKRSTVFLRDTEFHVYTIVFLMAALVIGYDIWQTIYPNFFEALRYSSFQSISIVTTTGFGTDNFDAYPSFSKILLVLLMFMGGSAGSTAGGMKISRVIVLAKAAYHEIYKTFRPNVIRSMKIGRSIIPDEVSSSIFGFFVIFMLSFGIGSLVMAAFGLDLVTATTSVIACLGNIGPGLARVGSIENFAFIPAAGKIFLSLCMIMGRLELYTVLVIWVPDFWKK